jgi:solute carrier family 39 (zinc transporter), member 1/2/3
MSILSCDTSGKVATWTDLRIAPVIAICVAGTLSAAFPILAYRSSVTRVRVPRTLFEYVFPAWYPLFLSQIWRRLAKYLGSGVIIATAFIHLLSPAISELTSPCLGVAWSTHVRYSTTQLSFPQ